VQNQVFGDYIVMFTSIIRFIFIISTVSVHCGEENYSLRVNFCLVEQCEHRNFYLQTRYFLSSLRKKRFINIIAISHVILQ
jgi:hypothetical protein